MAKKSFIANLFFLVLMNLLVKPFYIFGIDAEVQRQVGTDVYGNYFALLNLSFIFNIVLDLGISNYNIRSTASGDKDHKNLISGLFGLKLGLILPYFILSVILALVIGVQNGEWSILLILLCNQLFVGLIVFFRSNLSGNLLFKSDSLVSVIDRFLLIIICGYLLFSPTLKGQFKIEYFVYAQFSAYGITVLFSLFLIRFNKLKLLLNWDKVKFRPILKKSMPFALLTLLMMIYTRTDSIMLEAIHMTGEHQAGIYAMGYRWLDAFNMFAMLFTVILLPLFSAQLENLVSLKKLLHQGVKLLLPLSFFIAFFCYFNAESILNLRYEEDIIEAIPSFQMLMFCFPMMCLTYLFGTLITAQNKLRFLNRISLFTLILNIGLNAILIPEHGAYGAAIATLLTQSLVGFIQLWKVVQDLNYTKIIKLILPTIFLIFSIWAIDHFGNEELSFLMQILLGLIIYIITAFSLKWLNLKEIILTAKQ
jgi:O-antigen/teichoic acid export membrane protein